MNDKSLRAKCDDHRYSVRPPPKFHPSIHPSIRSPNLTHQQTNDHQRHSFQPKRRNLIDPTNPKSHLNEALWSATKHTVAPYAPRYSSPPKASKWIQGRVVVGRSSLAIFLYGAYASNRRKVTLRFSLSFWILWCGFLQLLRFLPSRFRYRSWIWIDLCFAIFVHWTGCSSTSLWRGVVICDHASQTTVRLGRQAHFTWNGGELRGDLS